jgi:hypothetical protein
MDDQISIYTKLTFRHFKKPKIQLFSLKKLLLGRVVCDILCHLRNNVSFNSFDRVGGNFSSITKNKRPAVSSSLMLAGGALGGSND